jgi:small subunit ribosomal protein S9
MTEETHDSSVETPAMTPEVEETPQTPEITLGETTAPVAEMAAPLVSSGPDAHGWFRGTGRRKSAVARVRIKPGTGEFRINRKKNLDEYFTEMRDQKNILAVLEKTGTNGSVDVHVNADGGGFTGQAGAIILGLGRALMTFDPNLEPILRDNAFLTRDARQVERKKYGQPGARKRFQFSKR